MGLFSKKSPCTLCGGKVSWLLPSKIGNAYICSACDKKIDMEAEKLTNLTIPDFQEYLVFYENNKLLKNNFIISDQIDFGLCDTKIIFDYQNSLFCISKSPDKTVFEGNQLKSLIIKEDDTLLFECSAEGIKRHTSAAPEYVMGLASQIAQFKVNQQLARAFDTLENSKDNRTKSTQYFDIPEPFQNFNVELHFQHPYWTVIKCELIGPRFSRDCPDVNDYMQAYQSNMALLTRLVDAFKAVAFPNASEDIIKPTIARPQTEYTTLIPTSKDIEELKKFKILMDEGIISKQEFEKRKKLLLRMT